MPSSNVRWLLSGFAVFAISTACKYDPHPEEGKQYCYQGRCVDGYVCGDDGLCYTPAHLPVDPGAGGAVGRGGSGSGGVIGTGGKTGSGGVTGAGGVTIIGTDAGIPGTGGIGGGGGSSTGGTTGTGGSSACQPTRATGSSSLIDDMADGDGAIISQDGRAGGWFTFNDGTGVQTPAAPEVTAKTGWICTSGSGFITWGAALAVSLNADSTRSCNYDVSVYKGVSFAIQGTVSGGRVRFSLNTSDIANAATTVGGTCVASSTTTNDCDDNYGAWMTNTSFSGTTTVSCHSGSSSPWTCATGSASTTSAVVKIPFTSMKQEGWGKPIALNLAHGIDLRWQAKDYYQDPATGTTSYIGPTGVDICIGNLSFY
jgi:hypothetical protein